MMTKQQLIEFIKMRGEFWYCSQEYCTGYPHGDYYFSFKKASADDLDQYDDVIDACLANDNIEPDFINNRIILNNADHPALVSAKDLRLVEENYLSYCC